MFDKDQKQLIIDDATRQLTVLNHFIDTQINQITTCSISIADLSEKKKKYESLLSRFNESEDSDDEEDEEEIPGLNEVIEDIKDVVRDSQFSKNWGRCC